jgi:DNA polymerase-3 subunit gamma/tau
MENQVFFLKERNSIMTYQALARKYRPSSFKDFKGHEVLVKVFVQSIQQSKLSHAYLLTGPRGVGKTTAARVIAKTINCSNLRSDGSPCEVCNSCKAMQDNSHIDVIECDAASRTGVDDVRAIIESSKFQPILAKYKVYIIDEVHMLSNSAFNALLKTLEEPPAHLVFVFATTEFKKIPATIISRCQTFNLNRISSEHIKDRLQEVCTQEGIKASSGALELIAKFSDGSLRDGLALLETASMYKSSEVSEDTVAQVLGLPDVRQVYALLDSVAVNNSRDAFSIAREIFKTGIDVASIVEELLKAAHQVTRFLSTSQLPASDLERELVKSTALKIDLHRMTIVWKMTLNNLEELKYTNGSFDTLEMLIMRLCYILGQHTNHTVIPTEISRAQVAREIERRDPEKVYSRSLDSVMPCSQKLATPDVARDDVVVKRDDGIKTFKDILELFRKHKELVLYHQLMDDVRVASFEVGKIEAKLSSMLPKNFTQMVVNKLELWTGNKWQIVPVNNAECLLSTREQDMENVKQSKLVRDVLEAFPGAQIKDIVKTG